MHSQIVSHALLSIALFLGVARGEEAVRINPENPHYLLFRGKPLPLISASEHYGSVINRPFDFEKYLDDAAEHKMTMTRTFLLYRELQSARNPSSPCKPESPDFITPFVRRGPGKALDGEPVYDLDTWNPEYFERLHRFLDAASKRGIVVELTVFSNSYSPETWALNPFRSENNLQHVGKIEWEEYITLKDKELLRRQEAYARKIIQETSQYGNIYYEICNEPGGGISGHATPEEVDAWQREMAHVMRDEMRRLNRPHLLAGQQAFTYAAQNAFPMDATYADDTFDIANDHPLPNTHLDGKTFEMGNFMSEELMLRQVGDYCRSAYAHAKPSVLDEDNSASMYRDPIGWTIHRKRAWTALFSGCHYDYIDFSITVGSEAGTSASRAGIRSWMQHLSEFISGYDAVHSHPDISWIGAVSESLTLSALVNSSHDYVAYLGDAREVTNPLAGQPIDSVVTLTLPAGSYDVSLYSPATGGTSPAILMHGGTSQRLRLPSFREDLVIRAILRKE